MSLPSHLKNNPDIKKIVACLKEHPILKAYLFGSTARNEESANSDIDLLVTVDSRLSLFDFIKIQQHLEHELKKTIDLVSDIGLSPFIASYIDNDKILIYEQDR